MLEVLNLSKRFAKTSVLQDISFEARPGEVTGVLGRNGTGKTTLLRLIAGLEGVDTGWIRWQGQLWTHGHAIIPSWHRPIGTMFQQPTLWPHLSVREHLEFVLRGRGLSRRLRRERCLQWLQALGLTPLEHRFPAELSVGQQSRVALARAMVREPQLLLLDEPFAPMDSGNLLEAWRIIREFVQSRAACALLVTQDRAWAAKNLARLVTLDGPEP